MNPELRTKTSLRDMLAYRHEPECKRAFADFYWRILLYIASIITLAALYRINNNACRAGFRHLGVIRGFRGLGSGRCGRGGKR